MSLLAIKSRFTLLCPAFLSALSVASYAGEVSIEKHQDCNLFSVEDDVKFKVNLKGFGEGQGNLAVKLRPFEGKPQVTSIPFASKGGGSIPVTFDLGKLDPGYYELEAEYEFTSASGETSTGKHELAIPLTKDGGKSKYTGTEPFSFGVAYFNQYTPEESRENGLRFGLKLNMIGEPGVWWRPGTTYPVDDFIQAQTKLGLSWTRFDFLNKPLPSEPGKIGTFELIERHPVRIVHKVEGYPVDEAWDEQRYGDYDTWKANGGGRASRTTVPKKEPYQKWLKGLIQQLPEGQKVFEIGNEVWVYMSGEEFADWAQMAKDVILEVKPDAVVGIDPGITGRAEFYEGFFRNGGMEGMNAVFHHPYSFTPLPENRVRQQLRGLRDGIKQRTGKDLPVYITEYGWATAPEDSRGHSVSEYLQAARTTRQSLMMYAEDCKVLIPHWTIDREYDITDREHWFGFFRLSGQPKPVVIAHATCARMIDGSEFIGDVWYEPGVGALLFEKDGKRVLALWTAEDDRKLSIDVDADQVEVVSMMGASETRSTQSGNLNVKLSASPIYLVGVGQAVADQAVPASEPLNPDYFSVREADDITARQTDGIEIDGSLEDWDWNQAIPLAGQGSGNVQASLVWKPTALYLAINVEGVEMDSPGYFLWGLSTKPGNARAGSNPSDYTFTLKPGKNGSAGTLELTQGMTGETGTFTDGESAPGYRWAVKKTDTGWSAEIGLPLSNIYGLDQATAGKRIATRFSYDGNDTDVEYGGRLPKTWALVELVE